MATIEELRRLVANSNPIVNVDGSDIEVTDEDTSRQQNPKPNKVKAKPFPEG